MYIYILFLFLVGLFYFYLSFNQYIILGKNNISFVYSSLNLIIAMFIFFINISYFMNIDDMFIKFYKLEFCLYAFSVVIIYRLLKISMINNKNEYGHFIYIFPLIMSLYFLLNVHFDQNKNLIQTNYAIFATTIYYLVFIILIVFSLLGGRYENYVLEKSLIKKTIFFVVLFSLFIFYYLFEMKYTHFLKYDFSIVILSLSMYYLGKMLYNMNPFSQISTDWIAKILKDTNNAIVITDVDYNIEFANNKFYKLIDYNEDYTSFLNLITNLKNFESTIKNNVNSYFRYFLFINNNHEEVMIKCLNFNGNFSQKDKKIFIIQNFKSILDIFSKNEKAKKRLKKNIQDEKIRLEKRNNELEKTLQNRESLEYQIKDIFCYDTLTGLYNRNYFMQNFEKTLLDEKNKNHSLFFLDLDSFKSINDSLGHSYGDDVIVEVSNRIRQHYKYKNVLTSRFGGDEFVLLFKDVPNENFVSMCADELIDLIKKPIYFDNAKIHLSASIGISIYPKDGKSTGELMKSADTAMYESKENGRSRYSFFDEKYRLKVQNEYNLTKGLINSVSNDELLLFYQPQIVIREDVAEVVGLESLMRWKKDDALISPGIFIPLAEKTNIISEMGKWAIFEACKQCKYWNDYYGKKIKIAINLSANQLMNPMLEDEVATALLTTMVDPSNIELEITESAIVKNMAQSIAKLNALKSYGVKISVDDFGTRYSTFNYLKQMPVDKIKIDISFVRSIGTNKIDEAIILSLIKLSQELKIDIIAEGVETQQQLDFLVHHGCNMIQGFYFFEPMPVDKLECDIDKQSILDSKNIFNLKN